MTILSYALIAIVALAVLHFIYEGIIAPSRRLELRFELFQLRDELRLQKIRLGAALEDKHFNHLQDSINSCIRHLPQYDLVTVTKAMVEVDKDEAIKKRLLERWRVLDDCKIPALREIRDKTIYIFLRAVTINSGGIWFYIVPIFGAIACYKWMKKSARTLLALSELDLQKVVSSSASPTQGPTTISA